MKCTASRLCTKPGMHWPGTRLTPCLAHGTKKKRAPKYKNKPEFSELANRRFDSAGERRRGEELLALEKAGAIRNLRFQVRYDLVVNGIKVCGYIADFVYEENMAIVAYYKEVPDLCPREDDWRERVEDYKGYETPEWKLKEKLFRAIYGFPITVVRPERKNFVTKGARKK